MYSKTVPGVIDIRELANGALLVRGWRGTGETAERVIEKLEL